MTIHVGVVLYNSRGDLPDCLAALRGQMYSAWRLYVLDNASTDGGIDWVREHAPDARLIINGTNVGFGAAHNRILRDLTERGLLNDDDFYFALNPDVRLAPDYLARLIDVFRGDARIGWGSGKLVMAEDLGSRQRIGLRTPPRVKTISASRFAKEGHKPSKEGSYTVASTIYSAGHALLRNGYAFNIGHGMADEGQFAESREVFGVPAAAVLMRAAFIRDVMVDGELYDETFFLYAEDTDVDWRGQRAGWRCWFDADTLAEHRGGTAAAQRAAEAVANRYLSAVKNSSARDRWMLILPLMLIYVLARAVTSPQSARWLIGVMVRGLPRMWSWRNRRWHDPQMEAWFAWSRQQPTTEPRSFGERWRSFSARR